MENTNTNTAKVEPEANVDAAPVNADPVPATSGTLKKVAFWGGIGVCALAVGAGLAYWLKNLDSSGSSTAENTAEALRR